MAIRWQFLMVLAMLGSLNCFRWELLMTLAMLGSLDGPSLVSSHGPSYTLELGWPFIGSFSWLCFIWELGLPFVGSFS